MGGLFFKVGGGEASKKWERWSNSSLWTWFSFALWTQPGRIKKSSLLTKVDIFCWHFLRDYWANHLSGSKSYESSWYNATLERAIEFKPEIVLLMSIGASKKQIRRGIFDLLLLFVVVVVVGPILFCMVRSSELSPFHSGKWRLNLRISK